MDYKIRKFFDKHIAPLHQPISANESCFLDLELDESKDSYFSLPLYPKYLYVNKIPFENESELEDYLKDFWKEQPAFSKLIPDLVTLAFILRKDLKEQSAELSPFVYEMF